MTLRHYRQHSELFAGAPGLSLTFSHMPLGPFSVYHSFILELLVNVINIHGLGAFSFS